MTTEGSGSPADEFEVRREADARPEVDQFREDTQPVVLKSVRTGVALDPRIVSGLRDPNTGQVKTYKPPMLTAEEQSEAVAALRQAMEQNTTRYPQLAQHMLNQPEDIWLLPELTLMFDAQPDQVTADLVGELSASLSTTTQDIEDYNQNLHASKTQELFWNDVGNLYDSDIRDLLLHQMAQLDPAGADRVGALALAWRDNHDMADEDNQMQLLLNIHQWSYSEDQALADKEQGGFWGGFFEVLDAGQEWVESGVTSLITQGHSVLSSPEEAARRQHLTLGQKLAYMAGLRPPDEAGDWGWWRAVSGGADAWSEIGLDPLNLLAGAGAGVKAVKTIPMASKATAAGRIGMGLRSQLPRFFSGSTRNIRGGRWSRLTYALRSKTVDDLLDQTVKSGVADEALRIIKADNQAALQRSFPQWGRMSDEMYRVIQENVETPEEFVQVLKAGALDEVLNSGRTLDDLERAATEAWDGARRYVDDAGTAPLRLLPEEDQLARKARSNWNYTAESLRPAVRTILEGGDLADDALRQRADALIKWWRVKAETPGGLKRALNADEIATWTRLDQGDEFFMDMASSDVGGVFAAGARKGEGGGWVMEFSDDTKGALNELNQIEAARGGDEWLVSGFFQVDELDEANKIIRVSPTREVGEQATRTLDDLLLDQNIPRDVRLNAARAQLSLDAHNAKTSVPFIISDIPTKPNKVFRWTDRFQGKGRGSTAARRILARATPGRPPDEIELFNTRKATAQLDSLFRHFGMREEVVDDLINEFRSLDLGARQDWFWDRAMRELGSEIGVPAFQHNLIQFYKGGGVRKFAGSGSDLWTDVTGKAHRMPILSSQFTTKMPLPLDEMMEVSRRARTIGERSTIAKALGWNGRGLGATKSRRLELVNRLRTQLGDEAVDMADEDLWSMAYSAVNPAAGMDGRGWWSGFLMPKAGSAFNNLHRKFTKLMLVTRPVQWMWRVALLEEPIRAHMYNMPSLYSNPLQYMGAAREAHLIENVSKWAQANSDFGHDVYRTLTAGADRPTLVNRLTENGILDDILDGRKVDDIPLPELRAGVSSFIDDALHSRTRINKLDPIKKVGWAVKKRTRKIEKAESALRRMGLPETFTFADNTTINQKLVSGYLGEEVGISDGNKIYQWSEAMTDTEAFMHGQVWGSKLAEIAEDPLARKALHSRAARLLGDDGDVADAVVNSSRWELLRHDMQLRFPDVEDDLALAQRYIDDVVMPEVDHLFRPFLDNLEPEEAAELLDEFARTRRISTELYGEAVDFDLRGANYAGGVRSVGDFTASMRGRANAVIPSDLPATTFDPRFMAHDDKGWVQRFTDWTLHTFGEEATQALNRRPAWIREFERWNTHYSKLGVPEEVAKRMANDHANQMVNYVFFQMDEAPYYAAKMNQYFPFAGATYEVLGAWSYKMPVAVGGTWPTGIGEFTRKFDRLMDGLVNTGLVAREEQDDGSLAYTLNLVPPDSSAASNNELGQFLQGAGFKMVNTLDQVISTIFGLEEGLELRSQGYRLAVGHPLNPEDFGVLSFAQANLGLNPQSNLAATIAGRFLGAGAPERTSIGSGGESLADTVDRLDIDINELVRYNREVFVDTEGLGSSDLYNGILAGVVDPEELVLPEGTILNVPDTSFWDGFIKDTFQPFGDIDSFQEFGINFLPGTMRWALAGLALQNQPSDEFWADTDLEGIFGGMLPPINEAQVSSQLNEAFMYLEAHDIVGGKGPFARIQEKEARLQSLLDSGNEEAANKLKREIEVDTEAFLGRAQKVAAESLILRSLSGQFLPTSPGHVRKEQELIQQYWDTLEYSDSIRVGKGEAPRLANFGSVEELENYYEQLSAWLEDPTGDRARATFRRNYPQLQAYLTPKTFYSEPVPDINSYEEYQNQIESGQREPAPLHVTMWRARSSAIQADFYNKYISQFGNDPLEAAANALNQRTEWQGLNDERNQAYQALEMWDDMHGGVYNQWRDDNYEPENWAQDAITDKLNTIRDNLGIVLELEDTFDVTLDLQGIEGLNTALRASIAEISNAIRDYTDFTENTDNRNAYEQAINQYFEEIYIPYQEQISALYDQLPEVADSERQSIIYERIKELKNQYANSTVFLNDNMEVPFPNPLEYSWTGKEPEEQTIKVQQWLTRPIEWMDQDQTIRITDRAPHMSKYLPVNDGDFDIYRDATLAKIEVDEMFEADEITRSERTKLVKNIEAQVRAGLIAMDRAGEVEFMDMTPFEKLELSGELPPELGIYGDAVRYYKEVLEVTEESAGTIRGRQIVAPLYDEVETAFFSDPTIRQTIQELGINIQDEDTLDNFLPFLFFGYTGER